MEQKIHKAVKRMGKILDKILWTVYISSSETRYGIFSAEINNK